VSDSCDASPAFSGAKALEVELRRHLVTPQFLTALRTDLERDLFPPEVQDRLNGFLRDVRADQPTLGQCVGLLRVLARFRTINRNAVDLCASGAYLRSLAGGYGLLDPRFLKDLQHIVDRYRNPAAHGAISPGDSAEFERLLFGEAADGLLPFLLLAARPRTVLPGEAS
jgi:hypothetical protein